MEILIYKTNISNATLTITREILDADSEIKKWSVDLDDCDRILRIVADKQGRFEEKKIEEQLKKAGIACEELV